MIRYAVAVAALVIMIMLAALSQSSEPEVTGYVDAGTPLAKTMYKTSSTYQGNHNADDSPGSYCASGYHYCDTIEVHGRTVETSGTGRSSTPGAASGWIDSKGGTDCADWSGTGGNGESMNTNNLYKAPTMGAAVCTSTLGIWCCQD